MSVGPSSRLNSWGGLRLIDVESLRRSALSDSGAAAFTRRSFLGICSTAGFAQPQRPFRVTHGNDHFSVATEHGEWHVACRDFSGTPKLSVADLGQELSIRLSGSYFPGTRLSSDFLCRIVRGFSDWRVSLKFDFALRPAEGRLREWLASVAPLKTEASLSGSILASSSAALFVERGARVEILPEWSIRFSATDSILAALPNDIAVVRADSLEIALRASGSIICIPRGIQSWHLRLPDSEPDGARLEAHPSVFEAIEIYATDASDGAKCRFTAHTSPGLSARFWPAPAVESEFHIPLEKLSYSIASDSSGYESAIVARIARRGVYLGAHGVDLLLAASDSAPLFESLCNSSGQYRRVCLPAVTQTRLAFDGAIGRATAHPGTLLALSTPDVIEGLASLKSAGFDSPRLAFLRASEQAGAPGVIDLPGLILDVLRPEDLLTLRFEFSNLVLQTGRKPGFLPRLFGAKPESPRLARIDPAQPAIVLVHFPPQHIAEEAIFEDSGLDFSQLPITPVRAFQSGASRLAFRFPNSVDQIPLTLDSLLDWSLLEPAVSANAVSRGGRGGGSPTGPDALETSIELPANLLISPNEHSAWAHSRSPVQFTDPKDPSGVVWTELWHTRLATRLNNTGVDENNDFFRTVRALAARDTVTSGAFTPAPCPAACSGADPTGRPLPTDTPLFALDSRDRYEIVRLTSDFAGLTDQGAPVDPIPIQVEHMFLSSQGAWVAAEGAWGDTDGISVRQYRQEAIGGRDQFVRVVYGGFLYPYGHRANLIRITERKFQRRNATSPIKAFLRQRLLIVIDQPVNTYGDSGLDASGISIDRQMPIRSLEITNLVTPNLDKPSDLCYPCFFLPRFHYPGGSPQEVLFNFKGIDLAGQPFQFSSPAVFVEYSHQDETTLNQVRMFWENHPRATVEFNGQRISFAVPTQPGDTSLQVHKMLFSGAIPVVPPAVASVEPEPVFAGSSSSSEADVLQGGLPTQTDQNNSVLCCGPDVGKSRVKKSRARPTIKTAKVRVPASETLTGPKDPVDFAWDPDYLKSGFPDLSQGLTQPNLGEAFGKLSPPISFSLPPVRSPGLFQPDIDLSGLSRKFGAINGLDALKGGTFDPSSFFGNASPTILGAISLTDILKSGVNFLSAGAAVVPKTNSRILYNASGIPVGVETRMDWNPSVQSKDFGIVSFSSTSKTTALLSIVVTASSGGGPVTFGVTGQMTTFAVDIFSAIRLNFKSVNFSSGSGQSPSVDIEFDGVSFEGGLDFISALEDFLKGLLGPAGPHIQLQGNAVLATAGFMLPDIGFGAFSLMHLALSTSLKVPLTGNDPLTVSFSFGSRNDPFLVAVTILGGGGYFAVSADAKTGVTSLEFSIEAGGVVSLDLFVASGSAHILIGFGIVMHRGTGSEDGAVLSAFLRAGGSLNVLGIITVSVEFDLTLTYSTSDQMLCGECTVTVSIDILFFSINVGVTLRRCFSVGGRDVADLEDALVGAGDWASGALERPASPAPHSSSAPRFADTMLRDDWSEYCDAFAMV
jgi:hypothetical protein